MKFWLKVGLLLAGFGLFAWYASRLDVGGLDEVYRSLGGWIPVLLLPFGLVYLVDTIAWGWSFARWPAVTFPRLIRVRWSGEAVSNVIPSAYLGGELVKVYLLGKSGIPWKTATASTVVSKTAQSVAQLVLVASASLVFVGLVPDEAAWRIPLLILFTLAVAALVMVLWLQRRGLFQTAVRWMRRLRLPDRWVRRVEPAALETDRITREFYRQHPARFLTSAGWFLAGWFLDTVEIFLFAWLSGIPISWWQALVVEAFTGIAKALGWFVPGSVGVQETGIVFVGRLAGLPDSLSVAYALFRRAREWIYALVGWSLLASEEGGLAGIRKQVPGG